MQLAPNCEDPDIEQALHRHFQNMEIFQIPAEGETPSVYLAGALFPSAAGGKALPELVVKCEGLKWVHIFGTGADTVPLELAGDKLITCSRGATAVPITNQTMAAIDQSDDSRRRVPAVDAVRKQSTHFV